MLSRVIDYLISHKDRQRIAIALAKGNASRAARRVDLRHPSTWEFSGFSQNGEDGIIDVLRSQLKHSNRYVVEIGAAEGTENNSSWLLTIAGYEGLMIEGDPRQSARARRSVGCYAIGSQFVSMFVTLGTVDAIMEKVVFRDPDVFSLDIDGNDWHIANALFAQEFRPKIVSVEYNSAFGPERSVTSKYRDDFRRSTEHPSKLYYGASLAAWKAFFDKRGYRFVTIDSNGVNAFFVDGMQLDDAFMEGLQPRRGFIENRYQLRAYGCDHVGQLAMMADQPFEQV
ncbi:hypothetical protein [Dyella nitratireducens]|uniref:Methyltransferase FkbM domain-containing protein n=1 Tax=Dyella nitratireducens TaxID=1849580 RepID=A0ABQ1G0Z5_9GAMM|nr:hypothetical protein [Dyella nitratireducens]GGA33346.1 hypothetical protein GCM10010981_22830 [Dyella nitratireducens]GLQ40717.1 hypothetical protein GCM10007902_05670 [Dyella nitratireducens]